MRPIVEEMIVGEEFSRFCHKIKLTRDLRNTAKFRTYASDVESIWKMQTDEGIRYFGFYITSGIREITERLYYDLYRSI